MSSCVDVRNAHTFLSHAIVVVVEVAVVVVPTVCVCVWRRRANEPTTMTTMYSPPSDTNDCSAIVVVTHDKSSCNMRADCVEFVNGWRVFGFGVESGNGVCLLLRLSIVQHL